MAQSEHSIQQIRIINMKPIGILEKATRIIFSCLRNLQLSKSSLAINGGAFFSAVSGWKSIPISVPGPCEVTESYRLLGFCLTYSFILSHTFTLDQCRVSRRFNSISPKTAKMDFSSVKFWISFCAGLVSTFHQWQTTTITLQLNGFQKDFLNQAKMDLSILKIFYISGPAWGSLQSQCFYYKWRFALNNFISKF